MKITFLLRRKGRKKGGIEWGEEEGEGERANNEGFMGDKTPYLFLHSVFLSDQYQPIQLNSFSN